MAVGVESYDVAVVEREHGVIEDQVRKQKIEADAGDIANHQEQTQTHAQWDDRNQKPVRLIQTRMAKRLSVLVRGM